MAQLATTTSLVGTVTDSSGKLIPGAKVTATSAAHLGQIQRCSPTDQGNFNFEFVRVGVYSVSVEQSGFQRDDQDRHHRRHQTKLFAPILCSLSAP